MKELTSRDLPSQKISWQILASFIALYLCLFAWFFPRLSGIEDEVGFINQAIVWSRGAISAEGAGLGDVADFAEAQGRHVSWRNPGRSLFVLPFVAAGALGAAFIYGAVIHSLLTLLCGLILAALKKSPLWAVLVLFHPTLALYSRTIMADESAALCLTLALAATLFFNRRGLWAGVFIGSAIVFRYQMAIVLPFFALALFLSTDKRKAFPEAVSCLLAGAYFVAATALYNRWVFGSFSGITYQYRFAAECIPENLSYYVVSLLVLWPGMLFAPFLNRSIIKWEVHAICWPIVVLLLPYYWHDSAPSWAETVVVGQRLLQPVLPAWIIAYAVVLENRIVPVLTKRSLGGRSKGLGIVAGLALAAASAMVFQKHQTHLRELEEYRREFVEIVPRGSLILGNSTLCKLFGIVSEDASYRWRQIDFQAPPSPDLDAELGSQSRPWFVGLLLKSSVNGSEIVRGASAYVERYHMTKQPTPRERLILYKSENK